MKYLAIGLIVIVVVGLGWLLFSKINEPAAESRPESETKSETKTVNDSINPESSGVILLSTNLGDIEIMLDKSAAPLTSANFEKLVREGFYNGLTFHRIIPGFVIQGGDPKGDGTGGPGYTVPAEIKLKHKRGSIATARTGDQVNPSRASSGSQFYIALDDLPMLDDQYTVFGQVNSGMEVVDKIAAVKTGANDMPVTPVKINKAIIK